MLGSQSNTTEVGKVSVTQVQLNFLHDFPTMHRGQVCPITDRTMTYPTGRSLDMCNWSLGSGGNGAAPRVSQANS